MIDYKVLVLVFDLHMYAHSTRIKSMELRFDSRRTLASLIPDKMQRDMETYSQLQLFEFVWKCEAFY